MSGRSPTFYILFSVATSVATMALKFGAYFLTGSVGLLSDALESFVNLAAALIALVTITYAHADEDEEHNFGHQKAEFFSSGTEGALIFVAAGAIIWSAAPRLMDPRPLEQVGLGLVLSVLAAARTCCADGSCWRARARIAPSRSRPTPHHLLTTSGPPRG